MAFSGDAGVIMRHFRPSHTGYWAEAQLIKTAPEGRRGIQAPAILHRRALPVLPAGSIQSETSASFIPSATAWPRRRCTCRHAVVKPGIALAPPSALTSRRVRRMKRLSVLECCALILTLGVPIRAEEFQVRIKSGTIDA